MDKLEKLEVDKLSEIWATSLILYVVGDTPSIGPLTRFIAKDWNCVAKPQISLHDDGLFIFKFASIEDRNEILFAGPHSFNS